MANTQGFSSPLLREKALIGGNWIDADSGQMMEVINPADLSVVARVPDCGAAETARAIQAAQIAHNSWRQYTAKDRAALLRRWFDLLVENREDLARLLSAEQGKPLAEARTEVDYGAAFVEWFAEEAKRIYGQVIPSPWKNRKIIATREPVGVVAAITPWNFPIAMITRKCGPALAAGCTIVIKPAEETPLSALAIAQLAEDAGIPAGVINVVTTSDPVTVGKTLTSSPVIRKISFTGSTEVGKILMRDSASTLKRMSLELGGNAPFLIFNDADLDRAVSGVMASKFRNGGQTCVSANRIYAQSGIYEAFVNKLAEAVRGLSVGAALSGPADIGPLINDDGLAKVEEHIRDAVDLGGKIVCGGRRDDLGGLFYRPTVIANASEDMKLASEETFGPVAPVFRFESEREAIERANATVHGLAAYFYSRDHARIWRVADALQVGMIGINEGLISSEVAPFGGVKESGFGREGSSIGIEDYINVKYLSWGGLDDVPSDEE